MEKIYLKKKKFWIEIYMIYETINNIVFIYKNFKFNERNDVRNTSQNKSVKRSER